MNASLIDVRDLIERFEALAADAHDLTVGEISERESLRALLSDLADCGGDEQWRGDWYPLTLIHDEYFEEYARELAEEIGAIPADYSWPTSHIDWEAAADALLVDYTPVVFQGATYYYR